MNEAHLFEGPLSPVWSCVAYLYTVCYDYYQAHPHEIPSDSGNSDSSDFEPYDSSEAPDDNGSHEQSNDENGNDSGANDQNDSLNTTQKYSMIPFELLSLNQIG